jgi:hypothetical protein|tara:strand:+ start:2275 stop:2769 length:495 start_codon:yes stop_codon:yes gene_type:complete
MSAPVAQSLVRLPRIDDFSWSECRVRQFPFSYTLPSNRGKNIQRTHRCQCSKRSSSMNNAITLPRPSVKGIRARDYILPAAIALACAGAAYAGADTTFDPALQKFTDFLEGSGGKIITVLSLAGGLIALASGRFALGQVAVPVGVGIGVGTGVPIVTSVVTATI